MFVKKFDLHAVRNIADSVIYTILGQAFLIPTERRHLIALIVQV